MEASFTIEDLSYLINIMKASNLSSMSTSEMVSKLTVLKLRKQDKHIDSISSPEFMFKPPSKVLGATLKKDTDVIPPEFPVASDGIDKCDKDLDSNSNIFIDLFAKSKDEFTVDSNNKSFVFGIDNGKGFSKRNGKPRRGATPHKNSDETKSSSLFHAKENLNPLNNNSSDKEWRFDANITLNNISSPIQTNKINFSEPWKQFSLFDNSNVSTPSPSVFISNYSPLFMDAAIPSGTKTPICKTVKSNKVYPSPNGLFCRTEFQGMFTHIPVFI